MWTKEIEKKRLKEIQKNFKRKLHWENFQMWGVTDARFWVIYVYCYILIGCHKEIERKCVSCVSMYLCTCVFMCLWEKSNSNSLLTSGHYFQHQKVSLVCLWERDKEKQRENASIWKRKKQKNEEKMVKFECLQQQSIDNTDVRKEGKQETKNKQKNKRREKERVQKGHSTYWFIAFFLRLPVRSTYVFFFIFFSSEHFWNAISSCLSFCDLKRISSRAGGLLEAE